MRLLVFHNTLWSQYKSVVFEAWHHILSKEGGELLVLQTALCESYRKGMVDKPLSEFPYQYPYQLIHQGYLEERSAIRTYLQWIKVLIKFKPQALNLTGYAEWGTPILVLLCKILGVKVLMTIESAHVIPKRNLAYHYKKWILNACDGFLLYGIQAGQFLMEYGVKKEKISYIGNCMDSQAFQAKKPSRPKKGGTIQLLYVGRLAEEKNLLALLNLLAALQQPKLQLTIIGDGPARETVRQAIQDLHLRDKVKCLDKQAWETLADHYAQAHALILYSKHEPWGVVGNEAMNMGLPIICTKHCGIAGDLVISGWNGLVLDGDASSEDERKLSAFLANLPEEQERYAQRQARMSQLFTVKNQTQASYNAIKNIVFHG